MSTEAPPIRVKMLGKFKPGQDGAGWLKFFPGRTPHWGNVEFVFDRHARDYDWLVVYDDLPSLAGERHPLWVEELACPPEHTLLITVEPSTIKTYGPRYLRQFRWLLTTQEDWALGAHPGVIRQQPALFWFYADSSPRGDFDTLVSHVPLDKTADLSTVCSSKRQGHTLHRQRYDFTQQLKGRLPGLEIYGHGVRPLVDKADALDAFRYHLAIENHVGPHHWTEKLADAFLGACLPIYYGCPNADDYFPPESFLRLDSLTDVDAAADLIQRAIRDRLWEKNLPAILEARRRVLQEYGPIATIARLVNERHDLAARTVSGVRVQSRRRLHKQIVPGVSYALRKLYVRTRHRWAGD